MDHSPETQQDCIRCRAPLLPNALFCSHCGFPVRFAPYKEPEPEAVIEPENEPLPTLEDMHGYRIGSMMYYPEPMSFEESSDESDDPPAESDYTPEEAIVAPTETVYAPVETIDEPTETVYAPEETLDEPEEPITAPEEPIDEPEETLAAPAAVIDEPEETAAPEVTAAGKRARLLSTGDFVLIELISLIPVVNLIVLLVWMFRRDGNLIRARVAQAKLLTFCMLLLACVIVLVVLTWLASQGVLNGLPLPAIHFT